MPFEPVYGEVIATNQSDILVRLLEDDREVWVPRFLCESADDLNVGDTDILVAAWFVEREGL